MSQQELAAIIGQFQAADHAAPGFSLDHARRTWFAYADSFVLPATLARRPDHAGGRAVEWLSRPGASERRAVLYLHGGGYIAGSITGHRPLTAELAQHFDGAVVSLDYRLGPEEPFPAAVEDAVAGYRYLLDRGIPAQGIAIAGDSAGAGLTVAAIVAGRERGLPRPGAAWALSPWSDLTHSGETIRRNAATDPIVFEHSIGNARDLYLAGAPHDHPLATATAGRFAGFPPLLIQVAAPEILLDDALRLARLAALDDVAVTLEVWPGMVHVWHLFAPDLQEARDAIARAARWLNQSLGSPPASQ